MKQLSFRFFLLTTFLTTFLATAQEHRRCATTEYLEHQYQLNPALRKQHEEYLKKVSSTIAANKKKKGITTAAEETLIIPVVVHVIANSKNGTIDGYTVTDEQIYSQIEALNRDYSRKNADSVNTPVIFQGVASNVNIQFCLATSDTNGNPTTGILRVIPPGNNIPNSYGIYNGDEQIMKDLSHWDPELYLNIWVAKLDEPALGGTLLGYASFPNNSTLPGIPSNGTPPELDGVAIHFRAFGTTGQLFTNFNLGRTTTHEVGHWLGLLHIWGDQSDCLGTDYCPDVPPCADAYNGNDCSHIELTCSSTQRMIQNYMDYSADDCMNIFTKDQKDRMRTAMDISPERLALKGSFGCCPIVTQGKVPIKEEFETNPINGSGWTVTGFEPVGPDARYWEPSNVGYKSDHSFYIRNDSVYNSTTAPAFKDYLETSYYDLNGQKDAILEFELAYAPRISGGATDALAIYYNGGCLEEKWVIVDSLYGNALTTASPTIGFAPSGEGDWRRIRYNLTNLPNSKFIKFRFIDYSNGINPVYIDNINVYRTRPSIDIVLSPNPSYDVLRAEVYLPEDADVKLDIYDYMGRQVLTKEKLSTSSFAEEFDVSVLAPGGYFLRALSNGDLISKKFIVIP